MKLIRMPKNLGEGSGENEAIFSMAELILARITPRATSVVGYSPVVLSAQDVLLVILQTRGSIVKVKVIEIHGGHREL